MAQGARAYAIKRGMNLLASIFVWLVPKRALVVRASAKPTASSCESLAVLVVKKTQSCVGTLILKLFLYYIKPKFFLYKKIITKPIFL